MAPASGTSARSHETIEERARTLFEEQKARIAHDTDRLFASLMIVQWFGAMIAALVISPTTWEGTFSQPHLHLWVAFGLGGIIISFPVVLALMMPGAVVTRYAIAIAQMLMGSILIHLTGGRIETHFHIYASLAFLAFYRSWRVIVVASAVVVLDHYLRGVYWPRSIFGVLTVGSWRWVEHAAWVLCVDVILIKSCLRSLTVKREIAHQQAELEAANRSAEHFAWLVKSSNDAIIGNDPDGRIRSWNRGAELLYGYCPEEIIGENLPILFPQGCLAKDPEFLGRLYRGDLDQQIETVQVRKDGGEIHVSLSVCPIKDSSGCITGSSTIARDITDRKRTEWLREAQRARQAMLRAEVSEALTRSDALGDLLQRCVEPVVQYLHARVAAIWILDETGSRLERIAVVGDEDDLSPVPLYLTPGDGVIGKIAENRQPYVTDDVINDLPIGLRTHQDKMNGDSIGFAGYPLVIEDKTKGVIALYTEQPVEEALEVLSTVSGAIAQGIGRKLVEVERTKLLIREREAREEAESANRVKSEFLSTMSHELRTPMNAIMGFTQRLLKKLGPSLEGRELDALQTVDRNAKHLLGLINDILDLSKIESGKMELNQSSFDLLDVIRDVSRQAAALLDNKPVEIKLELPDEPFRYYGDPVRIWQVILNLLSNGIKYTNEGTVTVTAEKTKDESLGRAARISVRDTGIGIKPEDLRRLFQKFTQLDASSTRKVGGTGLGLVITDQFAKMHGGRIDVTSQYGVGSEFTVILPLEVADRESPDSTVPDVSLYGEQVGTESIEETPASAFRRQQGATILCIDNEPDILKYLKLTFEEAGYHVILACSYDHALLKTKSVRPDLICLDLALPGKDGFEALNRFQSDPKLSDVPVVIVSANSEEVRSVSTRVSGYLTKPVEADFLINTVRTILLQSVRTAMVVEDNQETTELLRTTLADYGIDSVTATNGAEALERLTETSPSVIILDLMLPVMNGFTFLERLQDDPLWRKIPVIVYTSKTLEPAETLWLSQLCSAILIKGTTEITEVIESIFQTVYSSQQIYTGEKQ